MERGRPGTGFAKPYSFVLQRDRRGDMFKKLFGIKAKETPDNKRAMARVAIPGLEAKLEGKVQVFGVRDLSPSGIGLAGGLAAFRQGMTIGLTLFLRGRLLLSGVHVQIMRIGKGFVGCQFTNLDRQGIKVLHEVVLLEQKRLADIKKKEREKESMR